MDESQLLELQRDQQTQQRGYQDWVVAPKREAKMAIGAAAKWTLMFHAANDSSTVGSPEKY